MSRFFGVAVPVTREYVERLRALVEGVEVDLDSRLPPEPPDAGVTGTDSQTVDL